MNTNAVKDGDSADPRLPTFVTDGLYVCGIEHTLSAERLHSLGITDIVNAAREDADTQPTHFDTLHILARDSTHERLSPYFDQVARKVDDARRSGGATLVHCREGISRSVTLVLATRIILDQIPLALAFSQLKARRHQIEPNPQFLSELRQLELRVLGTCSMQPLTAVDDMRMPSAEHVATEQTLALMAKAAACVQDEPQSWPAFAQAKTLLLRQWDDSHAFEDSLLKCMEAHAGSSVHDQAAQSALRMLLRDVAVSVPGGPQCLMDRCNTMFVSEHWHDLCIDAPLLPHQAQLLISSLKQLKSHPVA